MTLAPLVFTLLMPVVHAGNNDCPAPTTNEGVEKLLGSAEQSLSEADFEGFQSAVQQASLAVPCMNETIQSQHAARLHQLHGIRLFVSEDAPAASTAFLAARVLNPESSVPSVFPEGHEIYNIFGQLDVDAAQSQPIIPPKNGTVAFDGSESRFRPTDRPTLVQVVGPDSAILETVYTMPGEALPDFQTSKLAPLYSAGKKNRLLQSSLLSGIGSAVLYGLAWQNFNTFNAYELTNTPSDETELNEMKTRSQILVGGSTVLLGISTTTAFASYRAQ
ncbi:MAG: hypothetical protein VX519_08690 [Myxococcota bacterium]|nr:hypothetical protein [Myxococcota bacterium]